MFPSLGYVDELVRAAERGDDETRSAVSVNRSAIQRAGERAFLDATSVTVEGELVGDGGLSYVLVIRPQDRQAVLKVAPTDAASDLVRGVRVYERLADVTGVPVPEVFTLKSGGAPELGIPYPYSVVEFVPGDELDAIAQFRELPRERQRALIRAAGRVLGSLHARTEFDRYGALSTEDGVLTVVDGTTDWATFYGERYDRQATDCEDSPVSDLASEAAAFFERYAATVEGPSMPSLLHGDFTPDNLVVDGEAVRAVLDWEHAAAGAPAAEAWDLEGKVVELFDGARRESFRDALREGYHEAVPRTDAFCARRALFAVAEFATVGHVRAVVADVSEEFDRAEFRRRAEAEFERRCERAQRLLGRVE